MGATLAPAKEVARCGSPNPRERRRDAALYCTQAGTPALTVSDSWDAVRCCSYWLEDSGHPLRPNTRNRVFVMKRDLIMLYQLQSSCLGWCTVSQACRGKLLEVVHSEI